MAGNYPDVPAARMPYDIDNTQVVKISETGVITALSGAQMLTLNNESNDEQQIGTGGNGSYYLAFIFPELRDLAAYYVNGGVSFVAAAANLETSTDTTNGQDGTWTSRDSAFDYSTSSLYGVDARNSITTLSVTGIKAMRFKVTVSNTPSYFAFREIHLYGTIAAGQTPDRLRFWHPTIDQPLSDTPAWLDFAEVGQNTTVTKQIRVKNNSSTQTAQGVSLSFSIPTNASPTLVGQLLLSTDNVTYGATASLGNLTAGTISSVVYVRKATSSTAQLGLDTARIVPAVTGWV
jgi:hypothetical protein